LVVSIEAIQACCDQRAGEVLTALTGSTCAPFETLKL